MTEVRKRLEAQARAWAALYRQPWRAVVVPRAAP